MKTIFGGVVLLAGIASAAVINFDGVVNGSANEDRTTPLTTQGYTFTSSHYHIVDQPAGCLFGGCSTMNGTQYIGSDGPQLGDVVVMTLAGGGTFRVTALQAGPLFVDARTAALSNFYNADHLDLTGALFGGGTVTTSIALPASGFIDVNLPGTFDNLVSLTIAGSRVGIAGNSSWAVDNIDATAIPEPATLLLSAVGAALLLGLRKHHQ